ncbi:hypothetical protein [Acetobacter nitrogenifigens]|uniref:Uncharacterized protein n=1 Tax=Acetobacter nitrogenifigens DSM 23921 = NBRC 105050 TaxID=1120919 RepID=A0A511XCP4_9PROT|nr:hypothetical protein [Acetobacter nitrogenifigens]GEN60712.1 hypothetical protein ANI02nite_25960 [Acetobacter nitrogenifigens DSM 23921 = NBRC 105050]
MEFQDHDPAREVQLHATTEIKTLRKHLKQFASTDPVVLAWAEHCAANLAEDNQTTEDMIRLSATVLGLILDADLEARARVRQSMPHEWCAAL